MKTGDTHKHHKKIHRLLNGITHRHLSKLDCLTAHTTSLVCFIGTVNGHSNKKRKKAKNVVLEAGT